MKILVEPCDELVHSVNYCCLSRVTCLQVCDVFCFFLSEFKSIPMLGSWQNVCLLLPVWHTAADHTEYTSYISPLDDHAADCTADMEEHMMQYVKIYKALRAMEKHTS